MRVRANECKKVVNKVLAMNEPPERSQVKPSKSQLKPELRYYPVTFFWLADDFKMVFKELIYMDFRCYSPANVTEFSENGSDSMKKEVNPILLH